MFENFGKWVKELERAKKRRLTRVPPGEYAGKEGVPVMAEPGSSAKNAHTGDWRVFKPVIIPEKCKDCGICWLYCPDAAIVRGEKHPFVDYNVCKGCLICMQECPFKAIQPVRDLHEETRD